KYSVPKEWFTIKYLLALLDPIAAVVKESGGCNYPTLALVFLMLRRIKKFLSNQSTFAKHAALVGRHAYKSKVMATMDTVCKVTLFLFKKRFAGMNFELAWISFLDPRFHKVSFSPRTKFSLQE
ncbi:hypothetical protein L915_10952, partial [Phytophthora nicotianae]